MLGAIIGDIVGSRFEFTNHRSKEFELFAQECFATDDSIMTWPWPGDHGDGEGGGRHALAPWGGFSRPAV